MPRTARRARMLALLLCSTPVAAQRSGHRVFDAAAIAAAGWHRIGDLAAALPPDATSSVDGFNHELSGSRLGFIETTGSRATWLVRLDGQPMPMRVAGTWILDLLPVAVTQLDSVVIDEGPRVTDGRATFLGTIDLYSRRPARGLSGVGDYQHGDESGDPGPYRYTARSTPNVEKIGPFASGAAAWSRGASSIDAAARYSSVNITDERLLSRIGPAAAALQQDVNASGGSGIAKIDALGGSHYFVGGRGRFTGFLYEPQSESYSSQLRTVATQAGASGSFTESAHALRYSVSATQLELQPLGTTPMPVAAGIRTMGDAFIEGRLDSQTRVGLGATTGRRADQERRTMRAWATQRFGEESIDVAVERGSQTLWSFSGRVAWTIGDSARLLVTASALRALRYSDDDWMSAASGAPNDSTMSIADLKGELRIRSVAGLRPIFYLRAFQYRPAYTGVETNGITAGGVASTSSVRRVSAVVRGEMTSLYDFGVDRTPLGFVEGALTTTPAAGFALSLSGRFAPSLDRPAHLASAAAEVPATRRIDFSINKSAWHNRVRAQLVTRNLLNSADRTHPFGAQWNLRTHLAITVALPDGAQR